MTALPHDDAPEVPEGTRGFGLGERRRHWLEAAAELSDALLPPIGTGEALRRVAAHARAASGARAAAVLRLPAGRPVEVAAQDPADVDATALVRRLTGAAKVAAQQSVSLAAELSERHVVLVPLRAHLGDPAVLVVVHDRRSPEDDEERELLASFADHAGLALDRAEAVAGRDELALVSERARIARDLHDDVIQRLFAAGMRLEAYRATRPDADGDALLAGVVEDLDRTIAAIRSTIFDLRGGAPA